MRTDESARTFGHLFSELVDGVTGNGFMLNTGDIGMLRSLDKLSAAEASLKGRINHSVCKWCYPKIALEDLCAAGKEMGLQSIELLQPTDFPTLQKHGLTCAMTSNPTIKGPDGKDLGHIPRAFNRVEHHDLLAARVHLPCCPIRAELERRHQPRHVTELPGRQVVPERLADR